MKKAVDPGFESRRVRLNLFLKKVQAGSSSAVTFAIFQMFKSTPVTVTSKDIKMFLAQRCDAVKLLLGMHISGFFSLMELKKRETASDEKKGTHKEDQEAGVRV